MRSIDILHKNHSVDFFFVEDYDLNELAHHEGKTAVRNTDAEAMVLLE